MDSLKEAMKQQYAHLPRMKNLFPVLIAGSSLLGPSPKKAAKEDPRKQKGGVAVKISPKEGKKGY